MVSVDSTPSSVAKTYASMSGVLGIVRKILDRPMSLADKVLLSHLEIEYFVRLSYSSIFLFLHKSANIIN